MTDIIKLEDMTLGAIQGLKKQIADEVSDYLTELATTVHKKFDVGLISFSVTTDIYGKVYGYGFESSSESVRHPFVKYDTQIKFSKEKEYD